ncbi:Flp family type IVb pilin [Sphingomonas arenae]|uniref:Flp family type IVb pilin n=1 Tax=Sphingomonas arenae TaxID=2812555 RepID=UPI0019680850|nr:Flp family type IVb pilin [Sphingomonas arenae]
MTRMWAMLADDAGASASDYALLLGVIGGAVALGSLNLGRAVGIGINRARDCINKTNGAQDWGLCKPGTRGG